MPHISQISFRTAAGAEPNRRVLRGVCQRCPALPQPPLILTGCRLPFSSRARYRGGRDLRKKGIAVSHTQSKRMSPNTSNVLAVIMGGGQGTRLFPLTKERSKPAVPLAGKYRLVDIPISNCINSNLRRIYILTQFNSASLHRHISQSYKFDHFSGGFVEVLAAQQTLEDTSWYQGTADAVRKNMTHFLNHDFDYLLVLSGDQLYPMDFRRILFEHRETYADTPIATLTVVRRDAQSLGIMEINGERRITRFVEKPKDPAVQDTLRLDPATYGKLGIEGDEEFFLASMGIYVFNREMLIRLLDNDFTDFGKHIIP